MRETFEVVTVPRPVQPGAGILPPRPVQMIKCSRCPALDCIPVYPSRLPIDAVTAKFRKRGWHVGDVGRHLCPACHHAKRRSAPKSESPVMSQPSRLSPKPKSAAMSQSSRPQAKPSASPAASDAIVNLYLILSDAYDRTKKTFKLGWDDERVARETGLAVSVVEERRERDFGPLTTAGLPEDLVAAVDAADKAMVALAGAHVAFNAAMERATKAHAEMTRLVARGS